MNEEKEKGIWQGKDGRWYAEISYQGRRWKHKGSPNKSTVQVWLSRKKQMIAKKKVEASEYLAREAGTICDFVRIETNHGPVKSSTYPIRKKRKDGSTRERWQVEVQYLGQKAKRVSTSREECEAFGERMAARINAIIEEANEQRDRIKEQKARELGQVKADEYAKVLDLFREVKEEGLEAVQPALSGYTYVLFDIASGLYKIGSAKDLRRRLSHFTTPWFYYVLVAEGNKESEMHKIYRDLCIKGEWYALTDDELEEMEKKHGFKKISIA